jgi:hypothetical protein
MWSASLDEHRHNGQQNVEADRDRGCDAGEDE